MKIASLLCVSASVVAQDYYPPQQQEYYQPPQQAYYQPQPQADYQQDYVQDHYQPDYVAPYEEPASYKDDSKEHFDLFWDNLELCHAEYDLASCLLDCNSRNTFFLEQRIADCTVKFVRGLCGKLQAENKRCDNGYIKLDADNCPTAAFADAFLVFNKMVTDLNSALTITPSFDEWIFTTIKLAVKTTTNNADCVINAFFNFLKQCAASNFISSQDIQCVETYLNDTSCGFYDEEEDGWNLPLLIERYGLAGAEEAIEKLKHGYGTDRDEDVLPALGKVLESIAAQSENGIHFVSTSYDDHLQQASVDVCPTAFVPMNGLYDAEGIIGVPAEAVSFHFPVNGSAARGAGGFRPCHP